jgi:3-deoxy-D-manno-octulosonate 8-phosphate phosphatase (KDO 8-P phosphatase)
MSGISYKIKKIKMLIMDVDGTLTDGIITIDDAGREYKHFNVKDGLGIVMLSKKGIIPVIISGRSSFAVEVRARELGVEEVYLGVDNKVTIFLKLLEKYNYSAEEVCYIGDDLNDLQISSLCGVSVTVADACSEMLEQADIVTKNKGGQGAVRELSEILLKYQ